MVTGKKMSGIEKYHHMFIKTQMGKFSIFKHLDIPGTEYFADEIQAKRVLEGLC